VAVASDPRYASALAEELAEPALERFLRYVVVDTQAVDGSPSTPSSPGQLELLRQLEDELRELGAAQIRMAPGCTLLARVPPTVEGGEPLGLIAHVDTAPAVSGRGVDPCVHRRWDGGPIRLPGDPSKVLDPAGVAELAAHAGHDIVTSDGTTLLGADDKAGVAEIMTAAAYLLAHPEIPHAGLVLAFTTDEEVNRGVEDFDVDGFGARFAFTADGSTAGEIQDETFNASRVTVTIRGVSAHTGTAKGIGVNAIKLLARLVAELPADRVSPETTEGREGFVHPYTVEGSGDTVVVTFLVRSFDEDELRSLESLLEQAAARVEAAEPRASLKVERRHQYANMKPVLERHPRLLEAAEEAIRRAGLEPTRKSIRGGTDGARLTSLGLPTPNLFTGGHEFHSEREWICVQDMGAAAATLVELARVWAEPVVS
jgi:tripeptide aminopeptidase